MVATKALQFTYDKDNRFSFPDISLSEGENLLILGPSGIGKTTLLHLLGGLLRPENGSILIDETDLSLLSDKALDAFRGRHIGVVFQRPHFVSSLTVKENLLLAQYLSKTAQNTNELLSLLDHLAIKNKANQKAHRLSEGQKQRASIAMALVNNPKLLLADEPTSSLDDQNCERVIQLLKQQAETLKANLIVITHDHRLKSHFSKSIQL